VRWRVTLSRHLSQQLGKPKLNVPQRELRVER